MYRGSIEVGDLQGLAGRSRGYFRVGESKGENAHFTTVSQQTTITIVILRGVC